MFYSRFASALLVFLLASSSLLFFPKIASAKIIDRIAAQVNKEIITKYDIAQAAPTYLLGRRESPQQLSQPGFLETIEKGVLQDMINRELFEEDAKQLKVSVSDSELNQYLAAMRQQQGFSTEEQQAAALQQYGVAYPRFRDFARSEILRMRLIQIKQGKSINVPDSEVEKKVEELTGHKGGMRPYIDVWHINLIPKEETPEGKEEARKRGEEALNRLKNGEDFETVAREMSDDEASAEEGGHIGRVSPEGILPEFADVAFKLPLNQVSSLVETPAGYHIILVKEKGEEPDPESEKIHNYVRAQLIQQKQEEAFKDYVDKLRQKSYIDVKLK